MRSPAAEKSSEGSDLACVRSVDDFGRRLLQEGKVSIAPLSYNDHGLTFRMGDLMIRYVGEELLGKSGYPGAKLAKFNTMWALISRDYQAKLVVELMNQNRADPDGVLNVFFNMNGGNQPIGTTDGYGEISLDPDLNPTQYQNVYKFFGANITPGYK